MLEKAYIGYHLFVKKISSRTISLREENLSDRPYIWQNFILFCNKTLLDWNGEGNQNSAQTLKDSLIGL